MKKYWLLQNICTMYTSNHAAFCMQYMVGMLLKWMLYNLHSGFSCSHLCLLSSWFVWTGKNIAEKFFNSWKLPQSRANSDSLLQSMPIVVDVFTTRWNIQPNFTLPPLFLLACYWQAHLVPIAVIPRPGCRCPPVFHWGLQCLRLCLWSDRIGENIHHDGRTCELSNFSSILNALLQNSHLLRGCSLCFLISLQDDPGLIPRICEVGVPIISKSSFF